MLDRLEAELDRLWGFALRTTRTPEDAADLVQRTCARAIERRHQYDPSKPLRSWLFRIAQNLWLNELRSRGADQRGRDSLRHDQDLGAAQAVTAHAGIGTAPENSALLADVERAMHSLPDAQREVLLLVAVEGFAYREMADILDIPNGTVMSRLARARLTIGQQFIDAGPSPKKAPRSKITSIETLRKYRREREQ